jgi:hypothetical protein
MRTIRTPHDTPRASRYCHSSAKRWRRGLNAKEGNGSVRFLGGGFAAPSPSKGTNFLAVGWTANRGANRPPSYSRARESNGPLDESLVRPNASLQVGISRRFATEPRERAPWPFGLRSLTRTVDGSVWTHRIRTRRFLRSAVGRASGPPPFRAAASRRHRRLVCLQSGSPVYAAGTSVTHAAPSKNRM